jgi:TonB family protein
MRLLIPRLLILLTVVTVPARADEPASKPSALEPLLIATPTYSDAFQKARGNGTVVVTAIVTPGGLPTEPALARSSDFYFLNNACLAAVERSRFKPRKVGTNLSATFTYTFELTASSAVDTYAIIDPAFLTVRLIGFSHVYSSSQ